MGSVVKRGIACYQAQVCVHGKRRAKTFKKMSDARRWLAEMQLASDEHLSLDAHKTVASCLADYRDSIALERRHPRHEVSVLNAIADDPIGGLMISAVVTQDIESWMSRRREIPSRCTGRYIEESTIDRMLTTLSAFFTWCVRKGMCKENPVKGVRRPKENPPRERIASDEDIERLKFVSGFDEDLPPVTQTQRVCAAFVLACLTGMRAGEMMMIERSWIDGKVLHIPADATKTNSARSIALSDRARKILAHVESLDFYPRIFGLSDENRDALWRKIRDKAGLREERDSAGRVIRQGLHFHDGRATFCTWAASPGADGAPRLDVLSLARQTGHKNLKMLMRYYRPSVETFADRLNK